MSDHCGQRASAWAQRPADFDDVPDALVAETPCGTVRVSVRCNLDGPQMADEATRLDLVCEPTIVFNCCEVHEVQRDSG